MANAPPRPDDAGASSRSAPTGEVTLVFTDVQGSTTLWERATDAMGLALDLHNHLLRELLGKHGGYEVKTEGDAFMLAFAEPLAAVAWAIEAQQALLTVSWPEPLFAMDEAREVRGPEGQLLWRGLRVRMGIHLGRPEYRRDPLTGRMDYFGPVVNRAARIAGGSHGGQILLGDAAWQAVRAQLAGLDHPACFDLGEHWFKGLDSAERITQVAPSALRQRSFAPIASLPPQSPEAPFAALDEAEQGAPFSHLTTDEGPSLDASGRFYRGKVEISPDADQAGLAPQLELDTDALRTPPPSSVAGWAEAPRPSRRLTRLAAWGLALVAVGGVGALVAMRQLGDGSPEALREAVQAMESSVHAAVAPKLRVTSEPVGASVMVGDQLVGKTPLTLEWKLFSESARLHVLLDGYETASLLVSPGQQRELHVALEPLAAPPPRTPPRRKRRRPR